MNSKNTLVLVGCPYQSLDQNRRTTVVPVSMSTGNECNAPYFLGFSIDVLHAHRDGQSGFVIAAQKYCKQTSRLGHLKVKNRNVQE